MRATFAAYLRRAVSPPFFHKGPGPLLRPLQKGEEADAHEDPDGPRSKYREDKNETTKPNDYEEPHSDGEAGRVDGLRDPTS